MSSILEKRVCDVAFLVNDADGVPVVVLERSSWSSREALDSSKSRVLLCYQFSGEPRR